MHYKLTAIFSGVIMGLMFTPAWAGPAKTQTVSVSPAAIAITQPKKASIKKQMSAKKTKKTEAKTAALTPVEVMRLKRLYHQLTQSSDNPVPKQYLWNRLGGAAVINADGQMQTKPEFNNPRSEKIILGPSKINLEAKVNDWVSAHAGFFYSSQASYYYPKSSTNTNLDVEEMYVSLHNFAEQPFYVEVGKEYLPFGRYHRYPILRTLPQTLSETRAPAGQVGFVDVSGLYGAAFVFNGLTRASKTSQNDLNNYGASVGYENVNSWLGLNVGADYLYNMADVGAIAANLPTAHFTKRVSGLSVHGDLFSGPFDLNVRYVTALRRFDSSDFAYTNGAGVRGSKPSATSIETGYQFKWFNRMSRFALGYQWSKEAYNTNGTSTALHMPKRRYSLGYGMEVLDHTIVALEYDHDQDYNARNGGTNKKNNWLVLRLTVLV